MRVSFGGFVVCICQRRFSVGARATQMHVAPAWVWFRSNNQFVDQSVVGMFLFETSRVSQARCVSGQIIVTLYYVVFLQFGDYL